MSEPKLTEWFPPDIVPVREGVYEVAATTNVPIRRYALFKSGTWWESELSPMAASSNCHEGWQFWFWRGLAKEPQ